MRRVISFSHCACLVHLPLTACTAKPKNGECKTSQDCADQAGYGKVCVQGQCQECGQDTDCQAGFVCRSNKCTPKPQCGSATTTAPPARRARVNAASPAPPAPAGPTATAATAPARAESAWPPPPPRPASSPLPSARTAPAFTIRFGFDQATLTPDSQSSLQTLADCLKAAPVKRVVVQGNADERGTAQYNVALGSRRADAARKYLSDLGVSGAIDTVSFGKERPVCRQSSEDCWAKNRRDDFVIER